MRNPPVTRVTRKPEKPNSHSSRSHRGQDAGSVTAQQARAKALDEYRKYQVRTLTPVEQAHIAQLEAEAKKAKEK